MYHVTGRPPPRRRGQTRRSDRRLLVLSGLGSAVVHAVLLLGISLQAPTSPRLSSVPVSRIVHVAPAMQAFDIIEVVLDVAPIDVQVIERAPLRPQPVRPTVPARAASAETRLGGDVAPEEPLDLRSVRDRLRYHLRTPQVWRPPTEHVAAAEEPTPQDLVQMRIASQLGEFNDSVAAEAAAAARAKDWTVADEDGGRWGISPEGIHLGSVTIPLGDSHFAVAPGRREEFAGRVRTWNELQEQAVREEARGEFKDRVKAIEERMNRERAARGGGTPAAPVPAPRDTTGSRQGGAGGR